MKPQTHRWVPARGVIRWPHCEVCGIVKRRDGRNLACKGSVAVRTRELNDPPGGEQGRAESKGASGGADGTQNVGPGAPRRVSSAIPGNGGA